MFEKIDYVKEQLTLNLHGFRLEDIQFEVTQGCKMFKCV